MSLIYLNIYSLVIKCNGEKLSIHTKYKKVANDGALFENFSFRDEKHGRK